MFSFKGVKEKLEKEKKAIEREIKSLGVPPEFGNEVDDSEEADETEEFGNRLGIQQVLRDKLENINSALEKINQGRYGSCEHCGKKISWILLKIEPTSRLCRKCKKSLRK